MQETITPFVHNFKVGDEVQLKLGRTKLHGTRGHGTIMLVNGLHELTNEPQCVWLGANLQPYVAYYNPAILVKCTFEQ